MWLISDSLKKSYLDFCRSVSQNKCFLNGFRQNPIFRSVTGFSCPNHAAFCWERIKKYPKVMANLQRFAQADRLGMPEMSPLQWNLTIRMSLDLLRYVETVCLLSDLCGDHLEAQNASVVELGSNAGILAHCLLWQWRLESYYLIDFPEVQLLSETFFSKLEDQGHLYGSNVTHVDIEHSAYPKEPTLFISEYCLSEWEHQSQLKYLGEINPRFIFMRENISDNFKRNEIENFLKERYEFVIDEAEKPNLRQPNRIWSLRRKDCPPNILTAE